MQEWVDRRSLEPHVFGDILEQVPKESIPESLDFFARRDVVQKLPLKKNQFCYSHGKNCQLPKAGEVDIDVSGMPCQENSRINLNRLFMEGKTGSVYLVWAKSHRRKKTPLLVLENTPELPMNDIQKLLPEYNLYQLFVRPEDAGHSAVNRLRTYVYCAHKETCEYLFDVFETYNAVTEAIKEDEENCSYFLNERERKVVRVLDQDYKRRNTGHYLHRASGRVMTSVDRLTALGWPTTQQIASNMMTTCFPTLDTSRGELMAGNAMALGNVSIVILVGLSCFKRVSDSENGWCSNFIFKSRQGGNEPSDEDDNGDDNVPTAKAKAKNRMEPHTILEELKKEYKKLGEPLSGEDMLEPEVAMSVAKAWMVKHAQKDEDGKWIMPLRVRHPGKVWIRKTADDLVPNVARDDEVVKQAPKEAPKEAPKQQAVHDKQSSEEGVDYKIIFRDGGHRLLKLSFLGKRLGDVPLPPGSNFKVLLHEGQPVLSGKAGTEMYSCQQYMDVLMPPEEPKKVEGQDVTKRILISINSTNFTFETSLKQHNMGYQLNLVVRLSALK
ncbi:unnamed protein product [Cladocopium goreaui]|uniref:Uncharacterized protein n=1 Tax=Cladocopium goreaui TaxID=2562237 RepID=A0A9P1CK22_9DINO|nr:unnamed protein product [Cladocopium goreaui]